MMRERETDCFFSMHTNQNWGSIVAVAAAVSNGGECGMFDTTEKKSCGQNVAHDKF